MYDYTAIWTQIMSQVNDKLEWRAAPVIPIMYSSDGMIGLAYWSSPTSWGLLSFVKGIVIFLLILELRLWSFSNDAERVFQWMVIIIQPISAETGM
jgi:hypothetical protein